MHFPTKECQRKGCPTGSRRNVLSSGQTGLCESLSQNTGKGPSDGSADKGACCLGWNLSWNLSWNFRALHRHDKPQCPTQNVGPPLQWNLSDRAGKSALWSERRSGVHSLRCHSEVGCARRQKGVSKGVTSPALTPWPEIRDPRTRLRLRGEIRRVWRVRRRWIVQGRGLPSSHAHRIRVLRAAKMALAVGARAPLRPEPDPGARL